MRKNFLLKHFIFLTTIILICYIYIACRKTDSNLRSAINTQTTEEKFFSSHRSPNLVEAGIVKFLLTANERSPFVEVTVKQIGYPRWDKMIKATNTTYSAQIKTSAQSVIKTTTSTQEKYETYYVPFVRDSQNHVNAAMIIKTSTSDTTIGYVCDWQYSRIQNNPDKPDDKAENLALFFMRFDKSVFGQTRFKITDKALFGKKAGSSGLTVTLSSDSGKVKTNYMQEFCQEYFFTAYYCPYSPCYGFLGSCDECDKCPVVRFSLLLCGDEWVGSDFGGSYGGGGTGGGGGGGNTPPGGYIPPSPCDGITITPEFKRPDKQSYTQIKVSVIPCDDSPGWIPQDDPVNPEPGDQVFSYDLGRIVSFSEISDAIDNNPGMMDAIEEGLEFSEHGYSLMPDLMTFRIYSEYVALKIIFPNWTRAKLIKTAFWNVIKDSVHFTLDLVGLLPLVGEAADLANGVIYFLEGDRINAALSVGSALPIYGWVNTGGKWIRTAVNIKPLSDAVGKVAFKAVKLSNGSVRLIRVAVNAIDLAAVKALKAVKPADNTLTNLRRELVDQSSHRILPVSGSIKSQVDDIALGDPGYKSELLCDDIFQTDGFLKEASHYGSDNGFDGVYIKKDVAGNVEEIIINESKQVGTGGNIRLGARGTNKGPQMSEEWITQTINEMKGYPAVSSLAYLLEANRNKIVKTVTAVDKSTKEIVILKLDKY